MEISKHPRARFCTAVPVLAGRSHIDPHQLALVREKRKVLSTLDADPYPRRAHGKRLARFPLWALRAITVLR